MKKSNKLHIVVIFRLQYCIHPVFFIYRQTKGKEIDILKPSIFLNTKRGNILSRSPTFRSLYKYRVYGQLSYLE